MVETAEDAALPESPASSRTGRTSSARDQSSAFARSCTGNGHSYWLIAIAMAAAMFALAGSYRLFSDSSPKYQHLGAEYYNIARALADGRGFSDPFGEPSGSTSWMPPLFSFVLAGLILVLGKKALVAAALVAMTNIAYAAIGLLVFQMAQQIRRRLSAVVSLFLYVGWLCSFYYWFFMMTQDIWLVTLLVASIARLLVHYLTSNEIRSWKWGMAGGLAGVVSPAVAWAWGVVTLVGIVKRPAHRRKLCAAMAIATALAVPWTARNALVFHQWIPIKSNFFYDAHLANRDDGSGVYVETSFASHPYNSPQTRFKYQQLGEKEFMNEHRRQLFDSVRQKPATWLANVGRRLLASTLRYVPFHEESMVGLMIRRSVFALPVFAFFGVASRIHRRLLAILGLFYVAYLAPYVVGAFYFRYFAPLTPIVVLVVFGAADLAAVRLARGNAGAHPAR
jgi:hypothetical protein